MDELQLLENIYHYRELKKYYIKSQRYEDASHTREKERGFIKEWCQLKPIILESISPGLASYDLNIIHSYYECDSLITIIRDVKISKVLKN